MAHYKIENDTTAIENGQSCHAKIATITLKSNPKSFYRHGWQSWSLTHWEEPNFNLPIQFPEPLHPMQTDPVYIYEKMPNGSTLAAVKFEDNTVLLLGALGLDAHVKWDRTAGTLIGSYEVGEGDWFISHGDELAVFSSYAKHLGSIFGVAKKQPELNVWCSWYSFYTAIDEKVLFKVFDQFNNVPFDVLQVDDGWQISVGDWTANKKFPSGMKALADKIKSTGRRAGLWLAPLIAVKSSKLFANHPNWFLRSNSGEHVRAGFNWGEPLFALDCTNPEVLSFLTELMNTVVSWGFDYIKLDFLYAGGLPGKRFEEMGREAAYRKGLATLREGLGQAFFLTCGAPVIPSIGLCDAMRIGPDVAAEWENHRDAALMYNPTTPGAKNSIRTTINRYWLNPLVAVDPDVVYFRTKHNQLTQTEMELLQNMALVCKFKATSDLPQWMSESEVAKLTEFLKATPNVERISSYIFRIDGKEIDFSSAMPLPDPPSGFDAVQRKIIGVVSNQEWILSFFNRLLQGQWEKNREEIDKGKQ
jgi:alpha-galactosidase